MNLRKLVLRVERFQRRHRMSDAAFGLAVSNNSHILARLRAGTVSYATIQKITQYLDKHEALEATLPRAADAAAR